MSTTGNPFSAAQAMAAFNQMNDPFGTQVVKLAAGGEPKDWLASEVKDAKSFWTTVTGTAPSMSDQEIAQFIQNNPETYNLSLLSAAENFAAGKTSPPAPSTPAPSTSTSSPAPVDLDAISVQQPASLAATSTPAPTWSTQQVADAGAFIAKNLNDPAKIEAKRKEIEQATGRDISVSDILAASKAANLSVSGALADVWSGDKYGPITTQDYYNWINQGVMERPEFSGQEAQAAMKRFGISGEDITRARALDPRFSAGAQFALTTPTYEESGKTGFAALNQKLRDYIQQNAGAIKPEQARERLTQMLAAGTLTGGQALNEYDVQRATGKTLDELFKEATKPKPFVPPPPINIPAAPSRPVNKIDVPGIDTAFREGPARTFNPATGTFQYTNPTKLAPATGSGTSWVPPVITSRQRPLLNVGFRDDITTPTYDAVSNMLYQPAASSSQRFAADRSAQMRALQQLRTSVPMGSSTFLQLQSRLRSGEFGGVGSRPVDASALEAAAKGYAAPTTKVATVGDKYFEKYPDVAGTYAKLDAATKAQFPTPSDYAQYHYDTHGRTEGREMPTLFAHGGPVVKKQSGGDVSRETASPTSPLDYTPGLSDKGLGAGFADPGVVEMIDRFDRNQLRSTPELTALDQSIALQESNILNQGLADTMSVDQITGDIDPVQSLRNLQAYDPVSFEATLRTLQDVPSLVPQSGLGSLRLGMEQLQGLEGVTPTQVRETANAFVTMLKQPETGSQVQDIAQNIRSIVEDRPLAQFQTNVGFTRDDDIDFPHAAYQEGGEVTTEEFIKKNVSRGTSSPNTAEVPSVDFKGDLIDENAEMRSESQRMLNRLKTAQQESYRRGKLPPGIQRAVTDVASEEKPPLVRGPVIQAGRDIVGGAVGATPTDPTNPSNLYRFMQAATGAALPEIPMARTAQAARVAAQEPRATMSAAGRSARENLEALGDIPVALAQPNQLGSQAGILRPPGGYFPTSRVPGKVLSNLDEGLNQVLTSIQAGPDDEKKQALLTLFNQKAKDFYTKQAGSVDDPLRQDILSGRIRFQEGTPMADLFPDQLQKGAAKGDLQSLRLLEKNYDQMIGLESTIPYRVGTEPSRGVVKRQIIQHIKDNLDQIPDAQLLAYAGRKPLPGPVGVAKTAAKVRQSLKDNPGLFETYLEPRIEKTLFPVIHESTDLYMAKYPSLSPKAVDKLRSPGFVRPDPTDPKRKDLTKGYFLPEVEQAIEKNQPIYDIAHSYFSLLGLKPEDLLREAKKLSLRELENISFAQFVKKAFSSSQEAGERKRLLEQVPKLIKEGKAPNAQVMLAGTKTFLPTSDEFRWVKVTDPDAVVAIAKGMNNSVYQYASSSVYGSLKKGRAALERGEAEIYSLYDKNNIPHMTVEYITNRANPPPDKPNAILKNTIAQFTGNGPLTGNDKPGPMYVPHIKALVDALNPVVVPDTIRRLLRDNN